jgi:hypothetical protein
MAEPLKATFFTLKHRDRAVLLPATAVLVLILAVIVAAWAAINWGALTRIFEIFRTMPAQLEDAQAAALFTGMMGMLLSTFLLLFPIHIAVASYEAACLRWMIRGETPGLFGLTLDHDTWRVWAVYWCWLVTNIVISFAASMLMMPFMFMMMGDIVAQGPNPDPQLGWELQLKMQALSFIQYIPMAFVGIRFGPAAATSIARRRFSFFEAWTVTSDRFWSLLGSWALLWLLFGLIYAALFAVTYGVLVGDLIPQVVAQWPAFPAGAAEQLTARIFSPRGLTIIGASYAGLFVIWAAYSLLGFGVNARVALAALEEEKIKEEPPET